MGAPLGTSLGPGKQEGLLLAETQEDQRSVTTPAAPPRAPRDGGRKAQPPRAPDRPALPGCPQAMQVHSWTARTPQTCLLKNRTGREGPWLHRRGNRGPETAHGCHAPLPPPGQCDGVMPPSNLRTQPPHESNQSHQAAPPLSHWARAPAGGAGPARLAGTFRGSPVCATQPFQTGHEHACPLSIRPWLPWVGGPWHWATCVATGWLASHPRGGPPGKPSLIPALGAPRLPALAVWLCRETTLHSQGPSPGATPPPPQPPADAQTQAFGSGPWYAPAADRPRPPRTPAARPLPATPNHTTTSGYPGHSLL